MWLGSCLVFSSRCGWACIFYHVSCLSSTDAVQMMLGLNFLGALGFSLLIFLGCDNVKMAGATLPYFNRSVSCDVQVFSIFRM